jgi:hypothetical protein
MTKILFLNYPNLNIYSKEQLGGLHHLKANVLGLKEFYNLIIVLNSFNIKFFKRHDNVIFLNIVPFFSKKPQLQFKSNYEIKPYVYPKSFLKIYLKRVINFFFNSLVGVFALFFDVSIYERANKILNIRSQNLNLKIIEINDEYYPEDLNFFSIALCVSSDHFKSQFRGLVIEQPWPSILEFKESKSVFMDFPKKFLIINTSPFGFDINYFKSGILEKKNGFIEILYIGSNKLSLDKISVVNFDVISDEKLYFQIIDSVDAVYISYSELMSNERANMGFPMKIIDALSRGKIVYTNINFRFISKYKLEKWVRINFDFTEPVIQSDINFLRAFFSQYIVPRNYFNKFL